MAYIKLGNSDLEVSEISFGAWAIGGWMWGGTDEAAALRALEAAIDMGITSIDTAAVYGFGLSEQIVGEVVCDKRDKVQILTKYGLRWDSTKGSYFFPTRNNEGNPVNIYRYAGRESIIQECEMSLKRLQTDYIDLYMVHQAQNVLRVKDEYFHKATDTLKKQGKIRFTGLSCHGPEWGPEASANLEDILMAAIEDGRFDVILLPYNFLAPELGERILNACKEHDIGTMIMKSNPILAYENYLSQLERGRDFSNSDRKYYEGLEKAMQEADGFFKQYNMKDMEQMKDGAMQFILTNPLAHTICCRFNNFSDVEKYIRLSGTTLSSRNALALDDFRNKLGFLNCRIGCNECANRCPHNVPVNTILRYNYYFDSHGREKYAMQKYKGLPGGKPDVCADCEGFCEKACPYGVLTRPLLAMAHQNLSLDGSHGSWG